MVGAPGYLAFDCCEVSDRDWDREGGIGRTCTLTGMERAATTNGVVDWTWACHCGVMACTNACALRSDGNVLEIVQTPSNGGEYVAVQSERIQEYVTETFGAGQVCFIEKDSLVVG